MKLVDLRRQQVRSNADYDQTVSPHLANTEIIIESLEDQQL